MSKIICNTVDFVFKFEIESMVPGKTPVLIAPAGWKRIDANESPTYQSIVKQNDAGPTNEETVTVQANRNNITQLLLQYCGFHTVLRMSTDEEIFYVGNSEYPCEMEITSDKIFDNYSFKAVSPA
jgi:hypothetical protein